MADVVRRQRAGRVLSRRLAWRRVARAGGVTARDSEGSTANPRTARTQLCIAGPPLRYTSLLSAAAAKVTRALDRNGLLSLVRAELCLTCCAHQLAARIRCCRPSVSIDRLHEANARKPSNQSSTRAIKQAIKQAFEQSGTQAITRRAIDRGKPVRLGITTAR